MLSIKKMSPGSEEYYLGLLRYFIRGGAHDDPNDLQDEDDITLGDGADASGIALPGEPAGIWMGTGAERLGLSGIVQPHALRQLMGGFHPVTGEPLVQNAGVENRCPGWDFTWSGPKGLDIVWSEAPTWMQQEIEAAQQEAVRQGILLAEQLTYSRAGKQGVRHVPAGLVVAAFEHGTSRTQDQKLHTHSLVLNLGVDEEGNTRTIVSQPLFKHKRFLGAYYRATLAHLLSRDLGLTFRRVGSSFEIIGVPEKLIAACSQRRAEILAHLKNKGLSGGKAAAVAALATRREKTEWLSRQELFARWQRRNAEYGFTKENLDALRKEPAPWTPEDLASAIDAATDTLSQRQSHFSEHEFLREVLHEAPSRGLPPQPLLKLAMRVLDAGTDRIILLGLHQGMRRFTTPEILAEEKQLLKVAAQLHEQPGPKISRRHVEAAIQSQLKKLTKANKSETPPQLSAEQRVAVEHLTRGKGSIRILQGLAGTGKTKFVLAVAHKAWTNAGYHVLAATPTGKAARVLQEDSAIESRTIALRLGKYQSSTRRTLLHHLRQLGRAARKRPTYRLKKPTPVKVDARTILVVDEAGMVTTQDTLQLMQLVHKAKGTIVLTGDRAQLAPIGRGAPFQSLSQRIGCIELTDIKRQDEAWARDVATHASSGQAREALKLLSEHQAIRVSDTVENAMTALVQQWMKTGLTSPREIAILANTNEQTEALNHLCQQKRLEAGCLSGSQRLTIFDQAPERGQKFEQSVHRGDRVLFTRNDRRIGVENGSVGTVIALRPLVGVISVELDSGKTILVAPRNFPHIRLGYAMTTYKSQGDTFRHVQVLITDSGQSLPAFYVQVTRAKESTTIFTTQALWNAGEEKVTDSNLAEVVSQAPDLRLASDLLHAQPSSTPGETVPPEFSIAAALTTPVWSPASINEGGHLVRHRLPAGFLRDTSVELPSLESSIGTSATVSREIASPEQVSKQTFTSREDQLQILIADAAHENNVQPDQVEVIRRREWQEVTEKAILHWLEITYRITKHLPRLLADALQSQLRRRDITETWRHRSQLISTLFLPEDYAAFAADAAISGRGATVLFDDRPTARTAIQSVLTTQTSVIDAWLTQNSCQRLLLDSTAESLVGGGFHHACPDIVVSTNSVRVVLQRHRDSHNAFTAWTAYPLLSMSQSHHSSPHFSIDPFNVLRYFFEAYLTVPSTFKESNAVPQAVLEFREFESAHMLAQLSAAVKSAYACPRDVGEWFEQLQLHHTLPAEYGSEPTDLLNYIRTCLQDAGTQRSKENHGGD